MEKPAPAKYPIHDLISRRWSPRAFSSKPVEREKIQSLLEAARWAASCFNDQPWYFILATKEDPIEFERLVNCLVPGNVEWASKAPVVMLSVARLGYAYNGKPNNWAKHDVGQAAANICVQATALGLQVHQMAGYDAAKARETYGIPEGFDPVAMMVIGYPGEPGSLPEKLQKQEMSPRERKSMAECVFSRKWGQPWAGL